MPGEEGRGLRSEEARCTLTQKGPKVVTCVQGGMGGGRKGNALILEGPVQHMVGTLSRQPQL